MEKHPINWDVELFSLQLDCKTPVAISDMHQKCMHVSSNYIHTVLQNWDAIPCRAQTWKAESICKGQTTQAEGQKHVTRPKCDSTTFYRGISATPKAGIKTQNRYLFGNATTWLLAIWPHKAWSCTIKGKRHQHTFTDLQSIHFLFVPIEKTANAKRHLPCSHSAW